jgi:arylsulfatase A-like enzyme/lysophospholipase L1-like esterase
MNRLAQPGTGLRAPKAAHIALAVNLLALVGAALLAANQSARAATVQQGVPALRQLSAQSKAFASRQRPSFVVIQTDDQTLDQLYATFTPVAGTGIRAMPNTLDLIAKKGVTFTHYYVSYPLCCPSRVSLLTGRYAHNHRVRGNVPPEGGYTGFSARSAFNHNIATWLRRAGYRTIHIGKFLNGYGDGPFDDGKEVPPGWSAWHSVVGADTDQYYYGYKLNDNGSIDGPFGDSGSGETRQYGERDDYSCPAAPLNGRPCLYGPDVFSRLAGEELARTSPTQPFYLQLDYTAPHGDFRQPAGPEPAPRHYDWFKGHRLPHNGTEGFDEGNVSDKPRVIREAPHLSASEIRTYRVYYDKALESLRSVDDGVELIHKTLGSLNRLRNTYIIFTSDNGFFYGEHRLAGGKFLAYEPSTRLPLLIRGPGIKPDSETGELVANIDITPTVLDLAGVKPDRYVDGRSLFPYAHDTKLRTRRPILFESFVQTSDIEENGGGPAAMPASGATGATGGGASVNARGTAPHASIVAPPKDYYGIRRGPYKYIEWPTGEKELYRITTDPSELNNLVRKPNLFPIRNFLHEELERLEGCRARICREVSGKLPLTRKERLRIKRKHEKKRRQRDREKKKSSGGQRAVLVATLGDSITAGWPRWDPDPHWRRWLRREWHRNVTPQSQYQHWARRFQPRLRFRNCGVPGERTDEIALRLTGCARRANVLLIQGGTNDLLQAFNGELSQTPAEEVNIAAADLRRMVASARNAGVRKVLLANVLPIEKTTPAQAAKIRRLNRAIRDIGRDKNVPIVPFFGTLGDGRRPAGFAYGMNADKIHPSVAGYRNLGRVVARLIARLNGPS